MPPSNRAIENNLGRVRERIARAAERSGRKPESIRLVAVTKYVEPGVASILTQAGCDDLGEKATTAALVKGGVDFRAFSQMAPDRAPAT